MTNERIELGVDKSGARLDKFLVSNLPTHSRAVIQRWIQDGYVRVNERAREASYKVRAGESVTVRVPPPASSELRAEAMPLDILYEDDDLIVINKPAGLVVHPAAGHAKGTLVNALLHHARNIAIGGTKRPGIVHRLDRDTSGVMLIAKTESALRDLQAQFHARTTQKTYLALTRGKMDSLRGLIQAPIGRHPRNRKKMSVVTGRGRSREAETEFEVRLAFTGYTLLELFPKTGRTHQLRVHLAFIGHPVVGDPVYGHSAGELKVMRQLLHAWKISFDHPTTGVRQTHTARLPADFRQALVALGAEVTQFDL